MLDIKRIRENYEEVKERVEFRGKGDFGIENVKKYDEERRKILAEVEAMKSEKNKVSREIPKLKKEGKDVTEEYLKGAKEALEKAKLARVKYAILKEGSPSCGGNFIHDGRFVGVKKQGCGE